MKHERKEEKKSQMIRFGRSGMLERTSIIKSNLIVRDTMA